MKCKNLYHIGKKAREKELEFLNGYRQESRQHVCEGIIKAEDNGERQTGKMC